VGLDWAIVAAADESALTQSGLGWIEIPQRSGRLAHRMRYIEATRRRTTSAVMGG